MEMVKYYKNDNGDLCEFKVMQDENPDSPREWDNATELYIEWGRNHYGDDFNGFSLSDILWHLAEEYLELTDDDYDNMSLNDIVVALQTKANDKIKLWYVFGYEHGGFTVSISNGYPYNDRWDGGRAGIIIVTKERCEKLGCDFNKAYEIAKGEVEIFDQYLQGNIYGYECDDDSCWGFYSDKWGDELFMEIATEAGYKDTKFYEESEVEKTVTVEYRLKEVM